MLHVQEAVVSVDGPVSVDSAGGLYLDAGVLDVAGVLVQHAAAVGVGEGLNKVLTVDVEQIQAITEPSVHQAS